MKGNKEKKSRSRSSACKKKKSNKITKREGKKDKKVLEPMLLPHLPEEIIFEITSRLPLGYRLKFRCVCKSWSIRFNNTKQIVLIGGDNEVYTLDNDLLTSPLLAGKVVRSDKLESSLASTALVNNESYFVGSCNGLVCASPPNNFFCLWNPTTNEYKLLPKPPSDLQVRWGIDGFGYDSNKDDYKVIHIPRMHIVPSKVFIYSLGSNTWKQIQHIPYMFNHEPDEYGVFCNGALHWLAQSGSDESISVIRVLIALDVTSEITREISNQTT
ncbi:putative F-box protein At3g16210 [Papaver somniferum]|uniref:putative F-box protein At3g16210 n=1 Tax=Papaver somniferum TaxID=3469 RepID=UPI000E6FE5E1|nr:putative F-box protein At3g16210 [Papaver somniferum]